MRKLEAKPTDRMLIDLHSSRDDLSIEIKILGAGDVIDPAKMGTLKRNLGILNHRIANHVRPSASTGPPRA